MHTFRKTIILLSLISIVVLISRPLSAQTHWCGTDQTTLYPVSPDPKINQYKLESRAAIVLPVVVHIVWNQTVENLSDSQILRQIERLNLDFNNASVLNTSVPKEFRKSIGSPGIRFCLARTDPDGKATSGITRTNTNISFIGSKKNSQNNFSIHSSKDGGKDPWDGDLYINIWVGKLENLYGRASIAGAIKNKNEDGIVIDPVVFNADPLHSLKGRTLVHEMGHYLGLKHTWGQNIGDCNEDDDIEDTPMQSAPYFDCPSYPQKSCNSNDMSMNFMDFVADECMHFFTKGQSVKMIQTVMSSRSTLLNSSSISCNSDFKSPHLESLSVKITHDIITIQSPTLLSDPLHFVMCNTIGQVLKTGSLYILPQAEIFIKNWPEGIYFLYFRFKKEHRVIKIMKQKK